MNGKSLQPSPSPWVSQCQSFLPQTKFITSWWEFMVHSQNSGVVIKSHVPLLNHLTIQSSQAWAKNSLHSPSFLQSQSCLQSSSRVECSRIHSCLSPWWWRFSHTTCWTQLPLSMESTDTSRPTITSSEQPSFSLILLPSSRLSLWSWRMIEQQAIWFEV